MANTLANFYSNLCSEEKHEGDNKKRRNGSSQQTTAWKRMRSSPNKRVATLKRLTQVRTMTTEENTSQILRNRNYKLGSIASKRE